MNYKSLPDSIFHMIQDDLFNRTVKFPRTNKPLCTGGGMRDYDEGVYDRPSLAIQIYLPSSEFPYNVELGRVRSWGQLNKYLKQQYGLTDEECQQVWDEFIGNICKNSKLPGLNESTDKQEKYLQYVITTLLNETIIDKENEEVHLPWGMMYVNVFSNFAAIDVDLHNPAKDLTGNIAENFWDMMEKTYGLRENEVERVWKIYGPTLSKKMHVAWFDDWIELMSRI